MELSGLGAGADPSVLGVGSREGSVGEAPASLDGVTAGVSAGVDVELAGELERICPWGVTAGAATAVAEVTMGPPPTTEWACPGGGP